MSHTLRILSLVAVCSIWHVEAAPARSLDMIRATGALHLCAHPNSLPYASKTGNPPGFQIELGEVLAEELKARWLANDAGEGPSMIRQYMLGVDSGEQWPVSTTSTIWDMRTS